MSSPLPCLPPTLLALSDARLQRCLSATLMSLHCSAASSQFSTAYSTSRGLSCHTFRDHPAPRHLAVIFVSQVSGTSVSYFAGPLPHTWRVLSCHTQRVLSCHTFVVASAHLLQAPLFLLSGPTPRNIFRAGYCGGRPLQLKSLMSAAYPAFACRLSCPLCFR